MPCLRLGNVVSMTTMPDGPLSEEPEARPTTAAEAVLQEAGSVLEQADPASLLSMNVLDSPRRALFVHAHPDDETINNGATMAQCVDRGVHVTLVTCTLGEEGEVLVPELAHLAADQDDALGQQRINELATAMEALGVRDHRFLGGPGRFRDSGMMGLDSNDRPGCFWQADVDVAADLLVEVIREVRPQVVVTYDETGGYGHPDHIQAHRVAMYAAQLAAVPSYRHDLGDPWEIAKIYWSAMSESRMRESLRSLRAAGDTTSFEGMDPDGPLPMTTPDAEIAAAVDGNGYVEKKLDALRAHRTQVTVDGPFFALSNNVGNRAWGTEFFRIAKGRPADVGPDGLETDLFAGL